MIKRRYTNAEDEYIRQHYGTTRLRFIAITLGRSYASVHQRTKYLGLKRTAKQRSAIYSGWSRQPKHSQPKRSTSQTDEHRL